MPRLYHSSATLLPDGRVEVSGGGHPPGFGVAEFRSEIFSPPYLFKGARPTISSAPSQANYGQSFFVATPDGCSITKVALIPQPTPTHAFNSNSGYVPLTFSQTAGGLTVTAPCERKHRPAGHVHDVRRQRRTACRRLRPGCGSPQRARRASPPAQPKRDGGSKLLSTDGHSADVRRRLPGADALGADVDLRRSLTPARETPGESIGSYGKRLVCTLRLENATRRAALKRGPP